MGSLSQFSIPEIMTLVVLVMFILACIRRGFLIYEACGGNGNLTQENRANRRWLIVSLLAWFLISALLFARSYIFLRPTQIDFFVSAALAGGGILTVIAVSLPYRIMQNLIRPERRTSRLRETVMCVLAFVSLVCMVIWVIWLKISHPSD